MIAGRAPRPGRQARAASPAGSSQPLGCGAAGTTAIGSRTDRGSEEGGTSARRPELAAAPAVAEDGGFDDAGADADGSEDDDGPADDGAEPGAATTGVGSGR